VSNRKRDGGRMRREWDAMARDDAMRYITDGTVADEEAFFRSGEALVAGVLASVGYEPAPGEAALEIGCGLGRTVRALAARFARVVGVDVSEEMIRQARDLLADCPNVELVVGNGTDLGFAEDGAFAFCFSYIAFQHIPDRRIVAAYLREIARVLGPGGVACIQLHTQTPGPWAWLRDRLRRLVGAATEAPGLRRLYRGEPRYPCRFVYPIPLADVERMVRDAGLAIDSVEAPHTPETWVACRKPS